MKALEMIEKHGVDARRGVEAIIAFYSVEVVCEELCEVIDRDGNVEDFAEFIGDTFGEEMMPAERQCGPSAD